LEYSFLNPQFWVNLGRIVLIDLLLAGDNALVIALAVRSLPTRQQLLGRLWGTAGAVGLRLLFIGIITYLLQIPWLQAGGGAVLIWIAWKLLSQSEGEGHGSVREGVSLWDAIWVILVADVSMSLDNVIAVAGAAHGDFVLVALGIGLSIPIVVWGSGLLARLMARWPPVVWFGGAILGEVAGAMIMHDPQVIALLGSLAQDGAAPAWLEYPVRVGLFAALLAYGWWRSRGSRTAAPHGQLEGRSV
jgi:YjbE family integral membrane protein